MKTQGKRSRQQFAVDCDTELTISCNPSDCRLVDFKTENETISFFKSCLLVAVVDTKKCNKRIGGRGQEPDEYVIVKGYAVEGTEKVERTVIVRDADLEAKKTEIVELLCRCNQEFEDTCKHPYVVSVSIVETTPDSYDVIVNVACDAEDIINEVSVIFQEPFDGPAPDLLEVDTSFVERKGAIRIFRFSGLTFDGGADPKGFVYLLLTDMKNSSGTIIGEQQEFEVEPVG